MSPSTNRAQSPFLDASSFTTKEMEIVGEQEAQTNWYEIASPFQSIYKLEAQESVIDPEAEEFAVFLNELYDQEFDDALLELINEASTLYEAQIEGEYGGMSAKSAAAESILGEHFTPLANEMENIVDALAEEVESRGMRNLTGAEIDNFVDQYTPSSNLAPNFEDLFGGWKKKLKKLAKKGLSLAKKGIKAAATMGIGIALKKLKRYVKPLLREVLKRAIKKLPSYLRPVARKLAKRYLGKYLKEFEDEEAFEEAEDATGDVTEIQQQFDMQIAHLLYAENEVEQEALLAEVVAESEQPTNDALAELELARAEFIRQIGELEEGEDPTAIVENFLPAILPVLKVGLKIAGRKRVVNYLAKYVAKLIQRFVGRKYARPLSRAVVDLGLRYFGLEVTAEEALDAAGEAVAYTVEETVRKVSALSDYILDDEQLLEGEVLKAFETAAASYLPPILNEEVYEQRPELRETSGKKGFWVGMPVRKNRRKGRRYRKFARRSQSIKLKPHALRKIKTWKGKRLSSHLRDKLGLKVGRELEAQIHLYQVMAGTSLSEISSFEANVPGLGTASKAAWSQLHPLTPEAAGLLLGEVGLGREVSTKYLNDPTMPPAVGQRFYYLEIDGARPQMVVTPRGTPALRHLSEVNLTMNMPRDQIQVYIFLSEARAQRMVMKLRQNAPIGATMTSLNYVYKSGLKAALSGGMVRRVKVIHNAVAPGQSNGYALQWLPQIVNKKLEEKLVEWLELGLSPHFRQQTQSFITATEADADGVTISVSFNNPPGLPKIRRVLAGEPVVLRGKWFSNETPDAKIQIIPGYQRE